MRVGDEVSAWDPETDKAEWKPVTAKSSRTTSDIVKLTLRDAAGATETLTVTANHPMLRADRPAANDNAPLGTKTVASRSPLVRMEPAGLWTAAGDLKPGHTVRSASRGVLDVVSVQSTREPARVLSFEVAELESYAVGESEVWGHNARIKPPAPGRPSGADGFKPTAGSGHYKKHNCDCGNAFWGWIDKYGDVWVPTGGKAAHGGEHWDVQNCKGKRGPAPDNVMPGGRGRNRSK